MVEHVTDNDGVGSSILPTRTKRSLALKMAFWNNKKIESLKQHHTSIKKFWFHDDIFKSIFFDTASVLIPSVEEYIVSLLGKIRNRITDQKIAVELEKLVEEESAHAKVHNSYNKMLKTEGYQISGYEKSIQHLYGFLDQHLSLKSRLAFCAAVEHFTASSALWAIDKKVMETGLDERMRKVWFWHFFEEIDHRSNMFDIYRSLGGGYLRRCLAMLMAATLLFQYNFRVRSGLLRQNGFGFNLKLRYRGFKFLWGKNGVNSNVLISILKYLTPGFHPSKINFTKVLAKNIHRYPIEEELMSYFPTSQ